MALEHVPRCQHVKVNGVQCGSPALRHKTHCYFHTRVQHERQVAIETRDGKRSFGFPLLEDANSIQVALMKVVQMLGAGTLDIKTAGMMLYALQTASYNLRHAKFEPEKLTDVVIDEDTVDLTRVQGPQWAARDFPPSPPPEIADIMRDSSIEDEAEEDFLEDEPETEPTPVAVAAKSAANPNVPRAVAVHKPAVGPADPTVADVARRRDQKRKLPKFDVQQALEDEPDSLAAVLLKKMGLPPLEEENETSTTN
jgi:hypothetical protein